MTQKILFIYTSDSSFIREDIDILGSLHHNVTLFCADNATKMRQIYSLTKLFFYLLFNTRKFDMTYIWFADYHSYLPIFFFKIFKKKRVLVIGGYDVCRIKDYKYGSFTNPIRGYLTKYSMKNASINLCVSHSVERVVKAISPSAKTTTLYNGIDFSALNNSKPVDTSAKEPIILCVSIVNNSQKYFIKGIDRLINVCRLAHEQKFILIGSDRELIQRLSGDLPENLEIIPALEHEQLIEYYTRAKIYCQLSRSESFSVSLAEAMYYNCIPVISNTGGMPEVTGEIGYRVNGDNVKECVEKIRKAMTDVNLPDIRERIEQYFTKRVREKAILQLLKN